MRKSRSVRGWGTKGRTASERRGRTLRRSFSLSSSLRISTQHAPYCSGMLTAFRAFFAWAQRSAGFSMLLSGIGASERTLRVARRLLFVLALNAFLLKKRNF